MKQLDADSIITVVDNLIGKTEAIGDTVIDEKRMKNLENLIKLTNWCLDGILCSAECRNSPYASIQKNANKACDTLRNYRDWINDVLYD